MQPPTYGMTTVEQQPQGHQAAHCDQQRLDQLSPRLDFPARKPQNDPFPPINLFGSADSMRMRLMLLGGGNALGQALIRLGAEEGIAFLAPRPPEGGWGPA
ncbi:MAG TPA: hypothetical protein VES70_10060, partial [Pseudomonas sp.]|nr:hypothetical protein [Pseudomonas sp.]